MDLLIRANKNSNYNNISYNNDVIIKISRYIENPGILALGKFSHGQAY